MEQATPLPRIVTRSLRLHPRAGRVAAIAFLCVMSAWFGGSFVMLVHAASADSSAIIDLNTRMVKQEVISQGVVSTVNQHTKDLAELESRVNIMTGVGLAIAAMAGVLQVVQMVARPAKA